jgi:hypothetical protein
MRPIRFSAVIDYGSNAFEANRHFRKLMKARSQAGLHPLIRANGTALNKESTHITSDYTHERNQKMAEELPDEQKQVHLDTNAAYVAVYNRRERMQFYRPIGVYLATGDDAQKICTWDQRIASEEYKIQHPKMYQGAKYKPLPPRKMQNLKNEKGTLILDHIKTVLGGRSMPFDPLENPFVVIQTQNKNYRMNDEKHSGFGYTSYFAFAKVPEYSKQQNSI